MARGDLTITLDKAQADKLQQILTDLSEVDKSTVVANALEKGMKVITDAGRRNLQQRNKQKTGNLIGSIGIVVLKKSQRSYGGFRRPKGAHAHLVDRGTAKRYTKKGYYRGSVSKGQPNKGSLFFTDAVQQNGEAAINKLMDAIASEMNKVASRS